MAAASAFTSIQFKLLALDLDFTKMYEPIQIPWENTVIFQGSPSNDEQEFTTTLQLRKTRVFVLLSKMTKRYVQLVQSQSATWLGFYRQGNRCSETVLILNWPEKSYLQEESKSSVSCLREDFNVMIPLLHLFEKTDVNAQSQFT